MKRKAEEITFRDFAEIDFGKGKIQGVLGDILHVEYPSGIRLIVRAYRYKPYSNSTIDKKRKMWYN